MTTSPFTDLPDELLICVCEQLADSKAALRQLVVTSRRLQAIAEPVLYRHIFFRKQSELANLLVSVESSPSRTKAFRELDVRCKLDGNGRVRAQPFELVGTLLRQAPGIQDLTMESPYCNESSWPDATVENGWDAVMSHWLSPLLEAGRPDLISAPLQRTVSHPLPALKRLTLHLNGLEREFWTINGDFIHLLMHPTIEELHLSSINIPDDATELICPDVHTPLKRLTLDEANVTIRGLHGLLAIPKALEYLYIGENSYSPRESRYPPGQDYNDLCSKDIDGLVATLHQQRASLQTLVYHRKRDIAHYNQSFPQSYRGPDFSTFTALRTLTITYDFEAMTRGLDRSTTTAPNLESLTVDDFAMTAALERGNDTVCPALFKDLASANPKLRNVDIVCEIFRMADSFYHRPRGRGHGGIKAIGEYLHGKDITFCVLLPPTHPRYVPPFLYAEQVAEHRLWYQNDEAGIRNLESFRGEEDSDDEDEVEIGWLDDVLELEENWEVEEDEDDEDWEAEMHWGRQS
ncbi:hypothetical protein LTR62_006785 [Meristemomyces frigidus]|uniref:F-box domain-containing protein n=1 Tax=Meristemomyces frigidus TaxID=1508187 RepID=A0AAN7TCI8_9PEZI|nr:hypothetical protein LTR62_006785 [Meristemomyces frigidus]